MEINRSTTVSEIVDYYATHSETSPNGTTWTETPNPSNAGENIKSFVDAFRAPLVPPGATLIPDLTLTPVVESPDELDQYPGAKIAADVAPSNSAGEPVLDPSTDPHTHAGFQSLAD